MDVPPHIRDKMAALSIDIKEGMLLKESKSSKSSPKKTRPRSALASSKAPLPEGFDMLTTTATTPTTAPYALRSSTYEPGSDRAPETWVMLLRTSTRFTLQASSLVKLRILLRDESASWIHEWVRFGGFRGWLERVKELCEVEWREDCRDDALLFEYVALRLEP